MGTERINDGNRTHPSHEHSAENPLANLDLSRLGLRISESSKQITDLYNAFDTSILICATGTGKTVGLPPILLKHDPKARIVETEPRNAPMLTTASYLSELVGDKLGGLVGVRYKGTNIGDDKKTRIWIEMEQSLINDYKEDHLLKKHNIVILDEAHEGGVRNLILWSLLLDTQAQRKAQGLEPLKIIAATATYDAEALREKLGKDKTGLLEIPGPPPFDIEKVYTTQKIPIEDMPKQAAFLAKKIIKDHSENKGDLLIFLPGKPEIKTTITEFKKLGLSEADVEILTLDSTTTQEQKDEISKKAGGKRRIILSTNSGETGITFPDDLYHMIDTGLIKNTKIDKDTGMQYLVTEEHSWSGCIQRDGRVGRKGKGKAWHLYTKDSLEKREKENKYGKSEVNRVELAPYLLDLLRIGVKNVRQFNWLEQPDPLHMEQALASLKRLGAINENEEPTEIGNEMAKKQTDIHLARMMVEGERLNISPVINTLSALVEKNESLIRFQKKDAYFKVPGSDFLTLLNIYKEYINQPDKESWAKVNLINSSILEAIARKHKDFDVNLLDSADIRESIGKCIAAGYKDQILALQGNNYKFLTNPNPSNIKIDFNSATANSGQMYLSMAGIRKDKSGQTLAQLCHSIKKEWIEDMLPKSSEPIPLAPNKPIARAVKSAPAATPDQTIPHESNPKHQVIDRAPEKTGFIQKIKSAFNRFINFIKKLFRF